MGGEVNALRSIARPADLVGRVVRYDNAFRWKTGEVQSLDPDNSAHVIIRDGVHKCSVHWLLCELVEPAT